MSRVPTAKTARQVLDRELAGSDGERALLFQLRAVGLPEPIREFAFWAGRRFRFDFAWPTLAVAAEVEGGTWTGGAHSRGRHFESDATKYNQAALLGWQVFRFTTGMVSDGRAIAVLSRALR